MASPAQFNLSSLDGSNGFVINGIDNFGNFGRSVSSAGDINGDGIDDLIIGAPYARTSGSYYYGSTGKSYVVFGSEGGFNSSLDLFSLDGSNGFVINGIGNFGSFGASVSSAGDINGDGVDDLIIGAPNAQGNSSSNYGGDGESYVVFGSNDGFNSSLDLSSLNGSNGFVINGIDNFGNFGRSVSSAGDINGDGIDDLIIGAPNAQGNSSSNYGGDGESYVVFGSNDGFNSSLDLSSLNGSNGFVINGIDNFGNFGRSVSSAGDINGDGIDDLIIGAPNAQGNSSSNYGGDGESYVVFGSDDGFNSSLDLSSLDGSNGFAINGIGNFGSFGASVSSAGDINGDGVDDLIIGAPNAQGNSSSNYGGDGESYVVFGSDDGFNSSLDLSSLDGSNGFVINGLGNFGSFGSSVSSAGDINGDGVDDLIIGAPYAQGNGTNYSNNGETYVIFGSEGSFNSSLDLSSLNGNNGFVINGIDNFGSFGSSVSSAGDINGDGVDDLIVGAPNAQGNNTYSNFGKSYVIFGTTNQVPSGDISDQTTDAYTLFSLDVNNFITDPEGDNLTFTANLLDGAALPSFLSFDESTGILTGLPTSTDNRILTIEITANDGNGITITDTFDLAVELPLNSTTNTIFGDSDNNNLTGTKENDRILGRGGNDNIDGNAGSDNLFGNLGNDTINGGQGNDYVDGGGDNDLLTGGGGNDILIGSSGNDELRGNAGNDTLDGGDGVDRLRGGNGDDVLIGGRDLDFLIGGNGNDKFVFTVGEGTDIIEDYSDGQDSFLLTGGLTFGALDINDSAGGDTIIRVVGGDVLAILEGVNSTVIDVSDFTTV